MPIVLPRSLALALLLAAVLAASAVSAPTTTFRVPSESMSPTLNVGQRITVDRGARAPHRGAIVVFRPPAGASGTFDSPCSRAPARGAMCDRARAPSLDVLFIKRVVAIGGDRIAMRRGHLVRNGVVLAEPYASHCEKEGGECDFPRTIVVPRGSFYALGDNRGASDDSRFWGPVRDGAVFGTVVRRYPTIPAPAVSFVASSTRMNEPVKRFTA